MQDVGQVIDRFDLECEIGQINQLRLRINRLKDDLRWQQRQAAQEKLRIKGQCTHTLCHLLILCLNKH